MPGQYSFLYHIEKTWIIHSGLWNEKYPGQVVPWVTYLQRYLAQTERIFSITKETPDDRPLTRMIQLDLLRKCKKKKRFRKTINVIVYYAQVFCRIILHKHCQRIWGFIQWNICPHENFFNILYKQFKINTFVKIYNQHLQDSLCKTLSMYFLIFKNSYE